MLKKRSGWTTRLSRMLTLLLCFCMVFSFYVPSTANAAEGEVTISRVKQTPMVRADGMQDTIASIVNNGSEFTGWAKITVGSEPAYMIAIGAIAIGTSEVIIPVTDTNEMLEPGETTSMRLELYDDEQGEGTAKAVYETSSWERTRHWEFYLSQQMHTDIGYTSYQENLKKSFAGFLDTAKQYIANSDNRETDLEKFKYAIESAFQMGESYMKNRTIDQIEEVTDLIGAGRMIIGAGQFNPTPENFSTEGAARSTYYTNRYMVDVLDIDPTTTQYFFDNPSISKGYVDIAVKAGIKYGLHSMNFARSPYYKVRQFDLYYMQGMDPDNKMLIFNGQKYTADYGLGADVNKAYTTFMNLINDLENRRGRGANPEFPYDKFAMALVPDGDNRPPVEQHIKVANELNAKWHEDGKYIYPRIKTAFPQEFFEDVEQEYGHLIPTETGTEENWWNDGWGTTAYESGIAKEGEKLIPVAETTASLASALYGSAYPFTDLAEAIQRSMLYNEHTWGSSSYSGSSNYHDQFEWKRSNAFAARGLADKVLTDSLGLLSSQVGTEGQGIYVYNPLNWVRDDIVTVTDLTALPEHFVIKDGAQSVPYTVQDGVLTFVAPEVPALGYKTYEIEAVTEAPAFASQVITGDDFIENDYYKVTFAEDGTIASIIDKLNGDREIVDQQAPVRFNQYQYYDDFGIPNSNEGVEFSADKWKLYTPKAEAGKLTIQANGYSAVATLNTSTLRSSNIRQHVTLYNDIPRIDILNEVLKESVPTLQSKEEVFYTFPFLTAAKNYEIRYDLPVGNTTEGEQVYGTSTDWYTANKWVNVKDKSDNYNMTLAIPNTSLLQFGERRTGNWSFDYQSEKPYIYSYVMNNMWHTNFQGDQPGEINFKYSISTNESSDVSEITRFGWETSTPLQATVITAAQDATGAISDKLIQVSNENVQVTTMKSAEANSDGMIIRFHEITGNAASNVTVTLPFTDVSSVTETDIIENDLSQVSNSGTFSFDLPAYGIKTFRVRYGAEPAVVTNLKAVSTLGSSKTNLSTTASVTASSEFNASHIAGNAKSIDNGLEWASKGEKNAWLQYDWEEPVTIQSVHIADRPNVNDNVVSATITFDDGTTFEEIADLPADGKKQIYVLPEAKTTKSLRIDIVGASSSANIGLLGLEAHSTAVVPTSKTLGTQLHWEVVEGALYYEIFRSKNPEFDAGSGHYVATTNNTVWFDTQVTGDTETPYYYRVRAAGAGAKGAASAAVTPGVDNIEDTTPPAQPILGAEIRSTSRIDLFWTPVTDDVMIHNYVVYRDGVKLGGLDDNHVTTYRDRTVEPGQTYTYIVEAVDTSGNVRASNEVTLETSNKSTTLSGLEVSNGILSPRFDGETTNYSLKFGNNFARLEGVSITTSLSEEDLDAVITVNGIEVESGAESQLIPIRAEGDTIIIRVDKDGETRIYEITASSQAPIIPAVAADAGSTYNSSKAVTNLINNSGMSGDSSLGDIHRADGSANDMWHTANNPGNNAWVEIDLGKVYPLDEMWIWNLNQSGNAVNLTRGLKNVKIEYSTDQSDWEVLLPPDDLIFHAETDAEYPFQLKQATGLDAMKATNLNDDQSSPVRFDGKEARFVRITAHPEKGNGSWGDSYFGLAELRFTSHLALNEIVPVESISISAENNADEISVYGGSLQLSAAIEPSHATYQDVIWSVTDETGNATNAAVITEDGKLIAANNGVVTVVATASDNPAISDSYTVLITGQKQLLTVESARAGSTYADSKPVQNLINGSGMSTLGTVFDVHDNHGSANTMWHSTAYPGENAWVEFDFGTVSNIGEMWIWNLNQSSYANRGMKDVKIEYKVNQDDAWIEWRGLGSVEGKEYPYTLEKASGRSGQAATNLVNGQPVIVNKQAQFIRITADPIAGQGTYGAEYYGLSEVRFTEADEVERTGTISGSVSDGEEGIEGVAVSVEVDGISYQATTAEDGSYTLVDVPVGSGYVVTASKAGYTSASEDEVVVDEDETTIVDLTLTVIPPAEHTGTISGTVTDGEEGIEGAAVSVEVDGISYQATTAEDGSYTLVDVPVGSGYVVTASKAGYTSASVIEVVIDEDETTIVDFTLTEEIEPGEETYALTVAAGTGGRITAGESGDYEAGQVITITAQANSQYSFNRWVTTGDGEFANATSASTTFTMPAHDTTVTATFTYIGSNNGGDGGNTPTPTPEPSEPEPSEPEPTEPEPTEPEPTEPEPETPAVELLDITDHWAKSAIERAVARGFVNGYGDGTFRADRKVTRGEFSTMLARALELEINDTSFSFTDREQTPVWAQPFIQALANAGYVSGYANDSFRSNNEINRTELVVIIVRVLGLEVNPHATIEFADADQIPAWATPYVAAAEEAGIVKGYSDGSFKPNNSATRAEAVTLILTMLNEID